MSVELNNNLSSVEFFYERNVGGLYQKTKYRVIGPKEALTAPNMYKILCSLKNMEQRTKIEKTGSSSIQIFDSEDLPRVQKAEIAYKEGLKALGVTVEPIYDDGTFECRPS